MKMKADRKNHPHHLLGSWSGKTTAYLLLLALSYSLGYLSASSSTKHSSSNLPTPPSNFNTTSSETEPEPDPFLFPTRCSTDPVPSKLIRKTILNRVFNGTSPYHNFPPPHIAPLIRLRPKRVKGWGSTGLVFENLIRKVRPRTIIEVGTFMGASAIHMAKLTSQLGLKTQILCIDDFRGWPGFVNGVGVKDIKMVNGDVTLYYQFMQNVVHFNLTVLPIPFSSGSALEKLCEWGVLGDLIEIDAGHDFHSAWSDINRAYKILRPGGVMFGHDYFTVAHDRGVRRAVNLFARTKGVKVRIDGQHWVIDSARNVTK